MKRTEKSGGAARLQSKAPPRRLGVALATEPTELKLNAAAATVKENFAQSSESLLPESTAVLVKSPEFQEILGQALTMVIAQMGGHIAPVAGDHSASSISRTTPRQRAAALKQRMRQFSAIYNAGWHVRYFVHGDPARRTEAAEKFCDVVVTEIAKAKDKEALVYAIADTLTCSPYGVPWEA